MAAKKKAAKKKAPPYDAPQLEGHQALRRAQRRGHVQGHPDLQARPWRRHPQVREGRDDQEGSQEEGSCEEEGAGQEEGRHQEEVIPGGARKWAPPFFRSAGSQLSLTAPRRLVICAACSCSATPTSMRPKALGRRHLLLGGGKILWMGARCALSMPAVARVDKIDLEGARLMPGLIDGHVHVSGGGGEAGFATRVPAPLLSRYTGRRHHRHRPARHR